MFRMRRNDVVSKAKGSVPAVHLQHGLTNSADDWIMADPQNSTAYVLANAGFDVWLGNNRGNKYSRRHAKATIHPDKTPKEFFDFSFKELTNMMFQL